MLDPALAAVLVRLGRDFRDISVTDIVETSVELFPDPSLDLAAFDRQVRAALLRLRTPASSTVPALDPPTDEGWESTHDPVREQEMAWVLELVAAAMRADGPLPVPVVDAILADPAGS